MKYRVKFLESELGWGQNDWESHYETYEEARDAYLKCNADLPARINGMAPYYYIQAMSVDAFVNGKWTTILQ